MTATVIYWSVQLAIWIVGATLFARREAIAEKHYGRKDSPVERVLMLVLTPVLAYGYACLGGFPPKEDQLYFVLFVTVAMHGVLIARWVRQSRESHK